MSRAGRGPAGRCAVAVAVVLALAGRAPGLPAQAPDPRPVQLRVTDPGPGLPGRIVRQVAAGPHRVVEATDRWVELRAGPTIDRSVVIVHGSARVAARIEGDLVVLDGDLRLGRGAVITGRAVAIGGHVYRTPFARVDGGVFEFPDDRFDAVRSGTDWRVRWGPIDTQYGRSLVRLPGFAGLRVAAYSRVDGLALTWGPELATGALTLRPAATWRTHRGVVDPSLEARLGGRRAALEATAARTTLSNERWLAGDLATAAVGVLTGVDLRNWYRADRATLRAVVLEDRWPVAVTVWGGVQEERPDAAAPAGPLAAVPWTLTQPTPGRGFDRPNPVVTGPRLTTATAGVALGVPSGSRVHTRLRVEAEMTALEHDGQGRFTQYVSDLSSRVPLAGRLRLESIAHAAWATGMLPSARIGAIGGPGSLLTEPVLGLRGERLLFGATRLALPVGERVVSPVLALRVARGLVGDGTRWLRGVTNLGAQLDVGPVRLEYAWDPAARRGAAVVVTSWVPAW